MRRIAFKSLTGAAAAAILAAPAVAAPLVVRSAGPSAKAYPPGRAVGENAPLILKAGDVVTVLAASGARTLRGPGSFRIAAGATAPPFNPLDVPVTAAAAAPEARPVGGLGVLLVAQLTRDMRYTYEAGRNRLSLHVPAAGLAS